MKRVLKTIGKVFLSLVLALILLIGLCLLFGDKDAMRQGWEDAEAGRPFGYSLHNEAEQEAGT